MNYTVTSESNSYFELWNEGVSMGSMDYSGIFTIRVTLNIGNDEFQLGPSNIMGSTYQVVNGTDVIAELNLTWPGNHVIQLSSGRYAYNRNFGDMNFTLYNEAEVPIAVVIPDYSWTAVKFTYEIETDDRYPEANNVLLLLSAIYCCNHMKKRMATKRV